MSNIRHNSEYIRLNYNNEQNVITDLNFTGKVKVPNPIEANEASTKGYVDAQKSQIINDITTQNPTLEKLHKIEWVLEPLSNSTTNPPNSAGLSFCQFLDADQMPLQLVAFSLDEDTKITNFNNEYLMGKYWTAYFAPTTSNNLTSAKWNIAAARQILKTLTPEDEYYLNAYDYIIKMKIQIDNIISVNYVPISIFNYQKVKTPSTAASTVTVGQNFSSQGGNQLRIWIDDEDSLNLFKLHIKNMIFSTYVYAGSDCNNTFRVRVGSFLNDKYVDFQHVFNQYTQNKQITNNTWASKAYMVSLNLVRDSTYNKKTVSPSITGLILNNKTPILYWREWDDTLQEFVFKERTYAEANADVST